MPAYVLDSGEAVVKRVNRTLFDLLPVTSSSIFIMAAAMALLYVNGPILDAFPFLTPQMLNLTAAVLMLVVVLMLISAIYVYSNNYLLVTTLHVIKVEQNGLFSQQTAQLSLTRVQDVTGRRHGVLGTVFNFGDIEVETAGETENFIFRGAPNPQLLADQLLQYHENFLKSYPERELP